MKIPVKYLSQWDSTASLSKNDCGATSVAMVLNYYGATCTSDEVFKKTGAGQGYITFEQLIKACNEYGFKSEIAYTQDLKQYIDKGIPVVTVVHYSFIPNRQDTFNGAHIFVVTGYDDKGYFVNDPNYWTPRKGEGNQKFIPYKDFDKARNANTLDNNRTDINLIIFPKITMKPSSKLPDPFYEIKEAKELIKRKLITNKDAFDTILFKFITLDNRIENLKEDFSKELEEAIKVAKKNSDDSWTDTLAERNVYIHQLELKVTQLEADSKGTIQTAKDLINKLKGLFGL